MSSSPESQDGSRAYGYPPAQSPGEAVAWVRVIMEKLWLIVLLAIAGFFITYGYLARQAPLYMASGTLLVEPPHEQASTRPLDSGEPNLSTAEELNTMVQSLQRPAFLLSVANDPSLEADVSLFPPKTGGGTYSDEEKIGRIVQSVHVLLQKGTLLIFIAASDPQPATAQRICEAMLENFVKDRMENKSGAEEETYQFLLSEADRLGRALANKERQIQKYDQLAKYDDQITTLKARLAELSQRYRDKYPAMIEARTLLQSLQDSFDSELLRIQHSDPDHAVAAINSPAEITDDMRARTMGEYQVLRRDIETQRALFQSLSAQKNQSDVVRAAQTETAVRIGDHPVLPEKPIPLGTVRLLLIGVFLGGLVGTALAFLLDTLDGSVRTVDQAETLLDLPVLSAVPEMAPPGAPRKGSVTASEAEVARRLPVLADGNSPPAEAIRSLRASMSLLAGEENNRRSVIFTSALPGEGKSFTAANYSLALANQNLRTLLIDADLRRPSVHQIFGIDRDHVGLVDYLMDEALLEEFVSTTSVRDLDLLLSGRPAGSPAELLAGEGFLRLIAEALCTYDRIVVDSAPINVVSDTLMLIRAVQSVCVVVRADSSPGEAVLRAVRVIEKSGKRPVGVVFNRVRRRSGVGYYPGSYYHYGSDRAYGNGYAAMPR